MCIRRYVQGKSPAAREHLLRSWLDHSQQSPSVQRFVFTQLIPSQLCLAFICLDIHDLEFWAARTYEALGRGMVSVTAQLVVHGAAFALERGCCQVMLIGRAPSSATLFTKDPVHMRSLLLPALLSDVALVL